jgi:hypothetical protein
VLQLGNVYPTNAAPAILFVSSGYGNSDVSSGVEGSDGVIGFGDKGEIGFGVIDFGGDNGDIGFGGADGVVVVVVVMFFIDFGRPQTSDSVELTNSSFGLLGSHIFSLSSGDIVVPVGGEIGDGNMGKKGICSSSWA